MAFCAPNPISWIKWFLTACSTSSSVGASFRTSATPSWAKQTAIKLGGQGAGSATEETTFSHCPELDGPAVLLFVNDEEANYFVRHVGIAAVHVSADASKCFRYLLTYSLHQAELVHQLHIRALLPGDESALLAHGLWRIANNASKYEHWDFREDPEATCNFGYPAVTFVNKWPDGILISHSPRTGYDPSSGTGGNNAIARLETRYINNILFCAKPPKNLQQGGFSGACLSAVMAPLNQAPFLSCLDHGGWEQYATSPNRNNSILHSTIMHIDHHTSTYIASHFPERDHGVFYVRIQTHAFISCNLITTIRLHYIN